MRPQFPPIAPQEPAQTRVAVRPLPRSWMPWFVLGLALLAMVAMRYS